MVQQMMMAAATDLRSIGNLASTLCVPVHRVHALAVELNIMPALTLNGIPHFDADQQDRLAEALKAGRKRHE